jgi:hypothetical protein
MWQQAISSQEANTVAAGCLLAEAALDLFASVPGPAGPTGHAYELLDCEEHDFASSPHAGIRLIREQLGSLLREYAQRGQQAEVQIDG